MQKLTTFLMFDGKAEEAMNFYTSLFEKSKVLSITRYGPNEAGAEGSVMLAAFSLSGQVLMPLEHYPFSDKFAWLSDRFGVSWQLSLAKS